MISSTHLQALVESRTWDKELVMWVGSEKVLFQSLGAAKVITLDLLNLFDPENLPSDDDAAGQQLKDRLPQRLRDIHRGPGHRAILVVKSIGLLARYNVGLKAFYDWFIGDFSMAILLLNHISEKMDWPEEIKCDSNKVLSYFSEPGMVKSIFNVTG